MRPFYMSKNKYGYYTVCFVNQETDKRSYYKSTHTADYSQAMVIATQWLRDGVPALQARQLHKVKSDDSGIDINRLLVILTETEAKTLYEMIGAKFGFSASVQVAPLPEQTSVKNVVNTIPAVTAEAPKKKVVVVHKKNALTDSGMIPAEIAQKCYEPLNPECTLKLCDFLHNFWNPEISEYIKNKRAHKKPCSDYHCKEMSAMVNRYWMHFFGEEFTVGELTEQYLEDFLQELANFRHLKGATINHARTCCATGLKWLKNKGIIHSNPMANVEAFSKSDATPRGIPTEEEIRKLFNHTWDSEVNYLAFNLSAFSGLRPGEISGLQVCDVDIDKDLLTIRHSWHRTGFLKSTKTNLVRKVPVAHDICIRLLAQAQRNPIASENSFVFWSKANDYNPYLPQYYDDGFFEALHEIGISETERKERNIDFYSLRHFCATYLANMTDMRNVQAVLGHTTPAMTQHYANHMTDEHFDAIRDIFLQSRSSILNMAA